MLMILTSSTFFLIRSQFSIFFPEYCDISCIDLVTTVSIALLLWMIDFLSFLVLFPFSVVSNYGWHSSCRYRYSYISCYLILSIRPFYSAWILRSRSASPTKLLCVLFLNSFKFLLSWLSFGISLLRLDPDLPFKFVNRVCTWLFRFYSILGFCTMKPL